jgi:hypothetical protein
MTLLLQVTEQYSSAAEHEEHAQRQLEKELKALAGEPGDGAVGLSDAAAAIVRHRQSLRENVAAHGGMLPTALLPAVSLSTTQKQGPTCCTSFSRRVTSCDWTIDPLWRSLKDAFSRIPGLPDPIKRVIQAIVSHWIFDVLSFVIIFSNVVSFSCLFFVTCNSRRSCSILCVLPHV